MTGGFSSLRASNVEIVSMPWRHHVQCKITYTFHLSMWRWKASDIHGVHTHKQRASNAENVSIWWRHQMETFSALLALCVGNSPVTGEFPSQRPVTRSFDVFFDLRLNKRLSKQSWGWWFETLSRPLWRHRNDPETIHDGVIKWKHFLHYWPFVWGIHWSLVNFLHKASDAELWCFLWAAFETTVE